MTTFRPRPFDHPVPDETDPAAGGAVPHAPASPGASPAGAKSLAAQPNTTDPRIRAITPADVARTVELIYELAVYEKLPERCHITAEQLHAALFAPTPALYGLAAFDRPGPSEAESGWPGIGAGTGSPGIGAGMQAAAGEASAKAAPGGLSAKAAPATGREKAAAAAAPGHAATTAAGNPAAAPAPTETPAPPTQVGYALYFLNFSTWEGVHGIYLEDLYVSPDQRGSGLGKAMLTRLAAIADASGFARVEWSVLDWNTPSIDFYRSLGAFAMDGWTTFRLTGAALASAARMGLGGAGY